jgi:uncharacterized protein YndB with AHSA1/START domain
MADEIEREVSLPVPAEEAWTLVTENDHLSSWLAPEVELDLRRGGEVRTRWDDGEVRHGTVEVVEAPRRLRFAWGGDGDERTVVEITVEPDGEGSRVRVAERLVTPVSAVAGTVIPLPVRPAQGPVTLAA